MFDKHTLDSYGDILNPKDIREILGIGYNQTYKLLTSGAIRSFKIGRNRKIPKECLKSYIDNMISNSERNT